MNITFEITTSEKGFYLADSIFRLWFSYEDLDDLIAELEALKRSRLIAKMIVEDKEKLEQWNDELTPC